jgi:adenylyltransferase/sulfurtransferase
MDKERYSRHFNLPGFTNEIQLSLAKKRLVVIGAGGLGVPVLQYLVAAGIGSISIIDHDVVSLTNLQRQVLYNEEYIGKQKAESAKEILEKLNSTITISASNQKVTKTSIEELLDKDLNVIIDASDNFETRYLVNAYSLKYNVPLIYGAIHQYEGQVSVFNYNNGASYTDLFPKPPEKGLVDNCDINGVLGPVAGMIGNLMAMEALKILTGIGKVLYNELLVIRFDDFSFVKMKIPKNKVTMNLDNDNNEKVYHSISSSSLKEAIANNEDILLLDVRQLNEFQYQHIEGSVNIPSTELIDRIKEIPLDKEVIVICNIGQKSMNVIRYLQNELNYSNLINLNGGVFSYFNDM